MHACDDEGESEICKPAVPPCHLLWAASELGLCSFSHLDETLVFIYLWFRKLHFGQTASSGEQTHPWLKPGRESQECGESNLTQYSASSPQSGWDCWPQWVFLWLFTGGLSGLLLLWWTNPLTITLWSLSSWDLILNSQERNSIATKSGKTSQTQ